MIWKCGRFDIIAKKEKISVEQVYEALRLIRKLEPRPGRPFSDETPVYITPDVYVKRVGEEYMLSLNESGMPKLRLSPKYQEMMEQVAKQSETNGKSQEGSEAASNKDFLQDRLQSAAWLLKSIEQRQQTIYRVTESIMKYQAEFLESGVSALRPLVLREIAQDVGMHESTISRVTTNKYVHTPQGVFEVEILF